MCRGSRFQISVSVKDLQGSDFECAYHQRVGRLNGSRSQADDEAYDTLCDWIIAPCLQRFQELTPFAPTPTDLTLHAFFYPPVYALKLVVSRGSLDVEYLPNDVPEPPETLMIPSYSVPQLQHFPQLKASDLRIVPTGKPGDDPTSDVPQRVCTAEGVTWFFKPAFHRSQFIREGEIQTRISDAGLRGKIKISNLRGIVVSDDSSMIVGSVLDLIPSLASNLHSREYIQARQYHEKWEQQIRKTIEKLHENGIVWGDVHPGNIIIDVNFDAWIVDFGGGCVEEFIDRQNVETEEGDWQGVQNVFQVWISRKRTSKGSEEPSQNIVFKMRRQVIVQ
ncbi:MAG: hypothetical protein M1817_003096 [Caeruleum heppii]|nr:MAG: hypothetical protein M1817_003096 [Caeruleum heppii]